MTVITENDLFRSRLDQALQIRGMKPSDLASKTGLSSATISQYRSGYSSPRSKKLQLLADVLNVDPVWLMGMDVPMEKNRTVEDLSPDDNALLDAYHRSSEGIQESVRILLGLRQEARLSASKEA